MIEEMKFNVISKTKDTITLEAINYDNTLLRPLVEEISKDEMVVEAKYTLENPLITNPIIYIKVNSGKPQAAIKRASKKFTNVFKDLETQLNKELTKGSKKKA